MRGLCHVSVRGRKMVRGSQSGSQRVRHQARREAAPSPQPPDASRPCRAASHDARYAGTRFPVVSDCPKRPSAQWANSRAGPTAPHGRAPGHPGAVLRARSRGHPCCELERLPTAPAIGVADTYVRPGRTTSLSRGIEPGLESAALSSTSWACRGPVIPGAAVLERQVADRESDFAGPESRRCCPRGGPDGRDSNGLAAARRHLHPR